MGGTAYTRELAGNDPVALSPKSAGAYEQKRRDYAGCAGCAGPLCVSANHMAHLSPIVPESRD